MVSIRIKVTVPKEKFADKHWVNTIADVMKTKTAPDLRREFLKTVFGWSAEKKPHFTRQLKRTSHSISMSVFDREEGDIYTLVNAGSPAHIITPKKARGFLRFRTGYRSATTPGSIQSRRAYRSGQFVGARVVHHPGFEARKFDELIAEDYYQTFVNDMQEAFERAARD